MGQDERDWLDDAIETDFRRPRRRRLLQGVLGLGLVALGVAGGVLWGGRRAARTSDPPSASATTGGAAASRSGDETGVSRGAAQASSATSATSKTEEAIEIALTPDAVERAGIKTATATSQPAASNVTAPATVTSNAYRDTKVNALVGGIVRQVGVELGATVERGQSLAVVFSGELADAQMKYLSMQAMLEADRQRRQRTEKLAAIGAASRQELEEITAVNAVRETELAAARQRLLLLGLSADQAGALRSASQIVSEVTVVAPAAGAVVGRSVNPGQVVASGQELFVVTDLGTVWVVGELYEKDFPVVGVGSTAVVTIPASGQTLRGPVSYIDPRVDTATRTARIRVEVPNRGAALRLGMYVSLTLQTGPPGRRVLVPSSAVQTVGERSVVYVPVAGSEGRFVERAIKVGPVTGESVQVLEGLKPGEAVVTDGSFFLRAEAGRTRPGG